MPWLFEPELLMGALVVLDRTILLVVPLVPPLVVKLAVAPALRAFIDDKRSASTEDTAGLSLVAGASEQDLLDSCFLVGSPSEVVDRIKALQADLGITHLVCRVHRPGIAHVDVVEAIRLLAAQVATRLAA